MRKSTILTFIMMLFVIGGSNRDLPLIIYATMLPIACYGICYGIRTMKSARAQLKMIK